jgi:L,D-transpeptidase YcbB
MKRICWALILVITLVVACKNKKAKPVERDTTITKETSFNNLFFDSVQLSNFIQSDSLLKTFEEQFFDFYKQRNYEYAWFDNTGLSEQAYNFYNLLNTTAVELKDSNLINPKFQLFYKIFEHNKNNYFKKDLLKAELLFTGQFFNYAVKAYKGIDFNAASLGWFIPTKKINLSSLLDTVLLNKTKNPEVYVPFNSQYKKLQKQLQYYYSIQKIYPTDSLILNQNYLQLGDSAQVISSIKNRLHLLGDLAVNDSTNIFDSSLFIAIKQVQKRYGLPISSSINKTTLSILNKPISSLIEQIIINLERARWLPQEKDSNYFLVNIPEFTLHVFDSAVNTWDMNVIVGKAATSTVIFSGNLKYIVFSPYWIIPNNIVKNEILPNIKKDKYYLEKNNMEQYGSTNGLPMIRQKAGPKNALGLVKFLFPNSYDIYFHDTPNKNYFSANNRSLSHGCIRLSEPKKLASYLLRNDTSYSEAKIDSLMNLPKEKWVSLQKSVPVFIVYFTTWVDKNGLLNFRNDIYGHDEKMKSKLFIH